MCKGHANPVCGGGHHSSGDCRKREATARGKNAPSQARPPSEEKLGTQQEPSTESSLERPVWERSSGGGQHEARRGLRGKMEMESSKKNP